MSGSRPYGLARPTAQQAPPLTFGRRFLALPEAFLAGWPELAWGEERLNLDLGDQRYALHGLSSKQLGLIASRYRAVPDGSLQDGLPRSVAIRWCRAPERAFREHDPSLRAYTFDLERLGSGLRIAGFRFAVLADLSEDGIRASVWTPELGKHVLGVLANVLRTLVAYSYMSRGGALLHSAGIVWQDRARLFVGQSGAGKSTLSGLAPGGYRVLSDDLNAVSRNAVSRRDDGLYVTGLPFTGDLGTTGRTIEGTFPLAAIYFLRHGAHDRVWPVSLATAVANLYGCAPFVNHDPHCAGPLLDLLERLIRRVPVYGLSFRPTADIWQVLASQVFESQSLELPARACPP
ncbi:MAG: hypothetical protein AAF560_12500 [Acidobacteriota bacterium]